MKFKVITLFPNLIQSVISEGVIGQAQKKGLIEVTCIQPRDFTEDLHKTTDDRPFGGGDGMVMLAEPLAAAIAEAKNQLDAPVIYLSPQGIPLSQSVVSDLAENEGLIFICGRYAGIDQRIVHKYVDLELSIGDYVLSGGELAAAVVIDAVSRQVPGVLGHAESATQDTFSDQLEGLLEAPCFTRPREFLGDPVPEILLSGNHQKIAEWKRNLSILMTLAKRPDLLLENRVSEKELRSIQQFWKNLSESEKEMMGLQHLSEKEFQFLQSEMLS